MEIENIKKMKKISDLCIDKSLMTKHDVFFSWSPHAQSFSVVFYRNGWEEYKEPCFMSFSLRHAGTNEISIYKILNFLRNLR